MNVPWPNASPLPVPVTSTWVTRERSATSATPVSTSATVTPAPSLPVAARPSVWRTVDAPVASADTPATVKRRSAATTYDAGSVAPGASRATTPPASGSDATTRPPERVTAVAASADPPGEVTTTWGPRADAAGTAAPSAAPAVASA